MENVKCCSHVKVHGKLFELGVLREQNARVSFEENGQAGSYWENQEVKAQWGHMECKQEAKLTSCSLAY